MKCQKCGQEVDKKAVVCPGCGCKIKKSVFKKWWFWLIIAIIAIAVVTSGNGNDEAGDDESIPQQTQTQEIVYEQVDLQVMFDDLDANAMKAENLYQKKYIEFSGKITNFDSDGRYVSVEPVNADEWNFTTAMCYIKNDTQKSFLIEKNVGDIITVKGKVKSIGEVLGYSIDINEVY